MATSQISLKTLFVTTTAAALIVWLAVIWWQLLLLLCVSVLPAIALLWAASRLRKNSDQRFVSIKTAVWISVLSILFLILYFLSMGPALYVDVTWLSTRAGSSTPWWLVKFYEPLQMFDTPLNPMRGAMRQYVEAWAEYCGLIQSGAS